MPPETDTQATPAAGDLVELQAWMQAAITRPKGGTPENEKTDQVKARILPSRSLTAAECLAIYGHGYIARLTQAFRAEFPCLLHALKGEVFDSFVRLYLHQQPPRSYTLGQLSAGFPEFLRRTRPADEAESWPEFLIDLATLERAIFEIHEGEGTENRELPGADTVMGLDAAAFEKIRFEPAPCLRWYSFRYPVGGYVKAVRSGESPELPVAEPSEVIVLRRDYRVCLEELVPAQIELLKSLSAGKSISEAAGVKTTDARRWILGWLDEGYFVSVTPPEENS